MTLLDTGKSKGPCSKPFVPEHVCAMVEFVLLHSCSKTCLPEERRISPGEELKIINDKATCIFILS